MFWSDCDTANHFTERRRDLYRLGLLAVHIKMLEYRGVVLGSSPWWTELMGRNWEHLGVEAMLGQVV